MTTAANNAMARYRDLLDGVDLTFFAASGHPLGDPALSLGG
ncbi:MAG TPA: hypothetical protein VND96_20320 [Candidatus Micrarchaeaceae archaeon]|nr:hypothetical protein [Candidatus Micrarchaeaceae archaeon]